MFFMRMFRKWNSWFTDSVILYLMNGIFFRPFLGNTTLRKANEETLINNLKKIYKADKWINLKHKQMNIRSQRKAAHKIENYFIFPQDG